jgi:hypothetical protein
MRIILISGKAQHGKNTTAEILDEYLTARGHRVLQIAFADYVKFICSKYYGWDGEKDERGRVNLQRVGTDIFRARDENFWVDTVIRFVRTAWDDYDFAIVPDWRFPNEYTRWAESGIDGVIALRVVRTNFDSPLTPEQQNHPSETALDGFQFDYTLSASDEEGLRESAAELLKSLKL